jgi:hypothetical protein
MSCRPSRLLSGDCGRLVVAWLDLAWGWLPCMAFWAAVQILHVSFELVPTSRIPNEMSLRLTGRPPKVG